MFKTVQVHRFLADSSYQNNPNGLETDFSFDFYQLTRMKLLLLIIESPTYKLLNTSH